MKLIATATISTNDVIRERDSKIKDDKGEYRRRDFAPGDIFEVPDEQGVELIRSGFATREAVGGGTDQAKAASKPKGKTALNTALGDAIAKLDAKNEDHFTTSGKPSTHAIEKIVGYDITAAERDEAWAALKAQQTK